MKFLIPLVGLLAAAAPQLRATTAPGPDAFGYTAEYGTGFSFTNITGAATRVLYFSDDGATNANLGFAFNFYGVNYTSVWFNVNGLITFSAPSYAYSNVNLTVSSFAENLPAIGVLWSDWYDNEVGADGIYFRTQGATGSRQFILQWNKMVPVRGAGLDTVTFQARLFEGSNQILLSYLDTVVSDDPSVSSGAYATVGIRDHDGHLNGRNLQWSFNQPVITNGLQLLFTPTNHLPQALDDVAVTLEDTPVLVSVLSNDTDLDGHSLTVTAVTGATNGAVTISNGVAVLYSPYPNASGMDSFTYTSSDGRGATATASVSVTVLPVNDPPAVQDDYYLGTEDTPLVANPPGVLANDTDPEQDTLVALLWTGPANGTLTLNPDGGFAFLPGTNFHGRDSFTYVTTDGNQTSAPVAVTLVISSVNDPPIAGPDSAATFANAAVEIPFSLLAANDSDPDPYDYLQITSISPTSVAGAALSATTNGVLFVPAPDYVGVDSFYYTLTDWWSVSSTGTVTVTIWPRPTIGGISCSTNNAMRLQFDTIPGRLCRVEASSDLLNWSLIGNASESTPGHFDFLDSESPTLTNRFYRLSIK